MKRSCLVIILGGILLVLVVFAGASIWFVRGRGATATPPTLVSMQESALAMERSAATMEQHARGMLEAGQSTGDANLVVHGEHWQRDATQLRDGGRWMAVNPLAPGGTLATPAELSAQQAWGDLIKQTGAMLHDPSQARTAVDVQAVGWNGLAMRGEGQNMIEHGRLMAEEVEGMVASHGLTGQAAADLRAAASTIQTVGDQLSQNGQAMIEYADRLRQSMGLR